MKTSARLLAAAAASSALAGPAAAQALLPAPIPASGGPVPGGTAPPAGLPQGIAPRPERPGGRTLGDFLGISKEQREYARRQHCETPLGAAMSRIRAPFTRLSGGLIPPFCPNTPSLAQLLDPGPVGAAAKVKQDRAAAEQRVKAVQYLGSVDCHYWPEAEEALIGALRNDRNECVRYEAAVVLANGCCCTPKVIAALSNVVSCSTADGAPSEKSPRVRSAAAVALERCLEAACGGNCAPAATDAGTPVLPDTGPIEKPRVEGNGAKDKEGAKGAAYVAPAVAKPGPAGRDPGEPMTFKEYYAAVGKLPRERVVEHARKALEYGARIGYTAGPEVNPTDYAAAGLPSATEVRVMASKPTNLWDALTQKSAPSIAQPTLAPSYTVVSQVPMAAVAQPMPTAMPLPTATAEPRLAAPPKAPAATPVSRPAAAVPAPLPAADRRQPITAIPIPTPAKRAEATTASNAERGTRNAESEPKPTVVAPPRVEPKPVAVIPSSAEPTPEPKVAIPPAPLPVAPQAVPAPRPTPVPAAVPTVAVPPAVTAPPLPPVERFSPAPQPQPAAVPQPMPAAARPAAARPPAAGMADPQPITAPWATAQPSTQGMLYPTRWSQGR